jgi:hypothetical protein
MGRELIEENILQSETLVQPAVSKKRSGASPTPVKMKKPLENQRLEDGAGEEGRTPDLMLGKHTL